MPRLSSRRGGLCALLVTASALIGAAPAMATITTSNVTTPSGTTFFQYDFDAGAPQTIAIAGTSDGTTGDQVDIVCNDDGAILDPGVPVGADGSFSVPDVDLANCPAFLVPIKAIPAGDTDQDLGAFTGPFIGFGTKAESLIDGAPDSEQLYDYDLKSTTASAYSEYTSVSGTGLADSYLFDSAANSRHGLWAGDATLLPGGRDGDAGRSEITIDGHDAYTPRGAGDLNSGAEPPPEMSFSDTFDPATGQVTIHETEPLSFCGDGSGTIVDPPPGSTAQCPQYLPAPATLTRTITESQDGRQSTIADDFSSTDGASHALGLEYDNQLADGVARFPGESAYSTHADGDVPLGASGPGSIFLQQDAGAVPSTDNIQAAISYLTHPDRAVSSNSGMTLKLQYARAIPATGVVDVTHVFVQGFDRDSVTAAATATVDAAEGPSVAITTPADRAVVTSDTIAITGTASDNVGVRSLAVGGLSTSVNPDGTWSQTISGLVPGPNVVTAVAHDAAGNAARATETVTYTPPVTPPPTNTTPTPPTTVTVTAPPPPTPPSALAPSCTVPKVTGLSLAKARTAIGKAVCSVGIVTPATSPTVARGSVLRQSRAARSRVSAYFPVDLVISSGKPGTAKVATSAMLKGATLPLKLSCPKADGNACAGSLTITTKARFGGHRVSVGTHTFSVRAGRSGTVVLTLRASLLTLVHRRHAVATTVSLKGSGAASGSLTITG